MYYVIAIYYGEKHKKREDSVRGTEGELQRDPCFGLKVIIIRLF
jgi:hypothetical protein